MENDDLSFEAQPEVYVHIPDDLFGPYNDGLPFSAGFNFKGQPVKWVNLQTEESDFLGQELLVKFIENPENFAVLDRNDVDIIMHRDEDGQWVDSEGDITPDVIGVGAIVNHLIAKDGEWVMDDGPDPLTEFEGFYIIARYDETDPRVYDVTIKGEPSDDTSSTGYYTVVYSDASVKTIDWQQEKPHWIERGVGVTAHSVSVGVLIERHFGPKE